jgi:phage gpG-like protein
VQTIILNSLDELPTVLEGVAAQFRRADYTGAFEREIAPELAEQHAEYFASATDPFGAPWAPLAPSTIARKGHDTILIDTKAMANSIVSQNSPNHVQHISRQEMNWGSADEKLPFHQFGTSRMPARPPVGVTEAGANRIAEITADATVEILKR